MPRHDPVRYVDGDDSGEVYDPTETMTTEQYIAWLTTGVVMSLTTVDGYDFAHRGQ